MNKEAIQDILGGGDLRSIGNVSVLVEEINNQTDFDHLFEFIYSQDRLIKMRAADALEKISTKNPEFLEKHKEALFSLLDKAKNKEFKWHLAQLISKISLKSENQEKVWRVLSHWVRDTKESNIVRVNSLQSLYNLYQLNSKYKNQLFALIKEIAATSSPSIIARIKKFRRNDWELSEYLSDFLN